jgi:ribosome recycling factor
VVDAGKEGATPEEVLDDAGSRMGKAIEILSRDLSSLRTGRATPALVEGILVDYYGVPTPLNQVATISVPEARLIVLQPWDKQALSSIEKSLQMSESGFNPSNDGSVIKVPIPPLNRERRQEMVRLLKRRVEETKVAVRNIRRDALDRLRGMERGKTLSQDDLRRIQERLQKVTDARVSKLDELSSAKEVEVMQV